MKKFLCVMFALATVFCFAGCKDGKCDDCKSEDASVTYYEDIEEELCMKCAYKKALEMATE